MMLLKRCLVVVGIALSLPALAQFGGSEPLATGTGVVDEIDYGSNSMIVSGYVYDVAIDANVEINGSFGAFTMLRPGMRIRFDYVMVSGSERRMVVIEEVPSHVLVEEA